MQIDLDLDFTMPTDRVGWACWRSLSLTQWSLVHSLMKPNYSPRPTMFHINEPHSTELMSLVNQNKTVAP